MKIKRALLILAVLAAAAIKVPQFMTVRADQTAAGSDARPAQGRPLSTSSTPAAASGGDDKSSAPNRQAQAGQPSTPVQAHASQPVSTQPAPEQSVRDGVSAKGKKATPAKANHAAPELSSEAQESYRSQMRELQDEAGLLRARAKAVRASLGGIKSQMESQGLGLRSDVLQAETRMSHLLDKAQNEIAAGDAVSAEQDLQMAAYAVEVIEKFLGR